MWSSKPDLPKEVQFPIQWVKEGLPRGRLLRKSQKQVEAKAETWVYGEDHVEVQTGLCTEECENLPRNERTERCAERPSEQRSELRVERSLKPSFGRLNELSSELSDELRRELPWGLSDQRLDEALRRSCGYQLSVKSEGRAGAHPS